MKDRLKFILLGGCVVFGFMINGLNAQNKKITLKDALKYALNNKSDVKKSQLKIKYGDAQISESKAQALPHISINSGLMYNPIIQETSLPGEIFGQPGKTILVPFGQKWNSSVGVTVQQNLFDLQVFIGLKAAKTTKEFYTINANLTEEQIIERVATAYYQVFIEKQKLETMESSYQNTLKVKNIIESLYKNGLAKKIDLDRTNVSLSNISTMRQQLINAVELQENALKFYIGMPINTPIELEKENFKADDITLNDSLNVENRTELKVLEKQKELLEFNKKATIASYYPSLGLVGTYAWQGLGKKFPIGTTENQETFWTDYANIGISLRIPIFSGNFIKSKVQQASLDLKSLEEDIKDTKLGLELEYSNAVAQIENNLIAIKDQDKVVKLAESVFSDTQNNYKYGLANLTDLLDAENSLVNAKNNYSNSILSLKLAEIQLIKSKGELKSLLN